MNRHFQAAGLILLFISLTGCLPAQMTSQNGSSTPFVATSSPFKNNKGTFLSTPPLAPTVTPSAYSLLGAGDISICGQDGDDRTADLLAINPGLIFTTGDNTNEDGTAYEYRNCFGTSWGRFFDRLRPSPGNHDFATDHGSAYYEYFSAIPMVNGSGYYSYEWGEWHILALNSVIDSSPDSPQVQWLQSDLEAHPKKCTLAYWHHPRWTSGTSGDSYRMDAFWQLLYEYGVDVVVNGNEHIYERFAPMDPSGQLDRERGIREFIAGTGGVSHYPLGVIHSNSEIRDNTSFGVLKFNLFPDHYQWEFIPIEGAGFHDSGQDDCH